MVEISISELSKHPKILDELTEIAKVVNKKEGKIKGVFIPLKDFESIRTILEEIEYRQWIERNKKGFEATQKELETLFEDAIEELGRKID
ncbi:MAG: hypothetical protein C6I00_04505 [Nitratiruptor sp.]|nr:hypothetical protein [Nitratiruptor sp.]NPA84351.1 hypothetical protein [Campylobacterota bacterium]